MNIKINGEDVDYASIKVDKIENITDGGIYQIELTKLDGNGFLKVEILEGIAIDTGELESELYEIDTNILIDNMGDFNKNFVTFTYE